MRQWLYVLKPTRFEMLTQGPTQEESEIVSRHFQHLQELTKQGVMILVGRTQNADENTIGLVIFEAEDESAARKIMEADPAIIGGVMRADLYPYQIALMRGQTE